MIFAYTIAAYTLEPPFYYKNHYTIFAFVAFLIAVLCITVINILNYRERQAKIRAFQLKIKKLYEQLVYFEQEFIANPNKRPVEYYYSKMSKISREYTDLLYQIDALYKTKREIYILKVTYLEPIIEKCYKAQFSSQKGSYQDCIQTFSEVKGIF